jgi:hypothetical protein
MFNEKIVNLISYLVLSSFLDASGLEPFFVLWVGAGCPSLLDAGKNASTFLKSSLGTSPWVDSIVRWYGRMAEELKALGHSKATIADMDALLAILLACRNPECSTNWGGLTPNDKKTVQKMVRQAQAYASANRLIPSGTRGKLVSLQGEAVGDTDYLSAELKVIDEFVAPADADKLPAVTDTGIMVKDPFNADEIADLVEKYGKSKAMEAINSRKELLRIEKALREGKAANEVPVRKLRAVSPASDLPYFLNEIWLQIHSIWDEKLSETEIVFEEEIITSTVHYSVSEDAYKALAEQYKRVNAEIAVLRENLKKAENVTDRIRLGALEKQHEEVVRAMNSKSNNKTVPHGSVQYVIPSWTQKVRCAPVNMATMRGLLRQWRLTTVDKLDMDSKEREVEINSFIDQTIVTMLKTQVKSKAVDLAVSVLDLATATQSSINDLMAKSRTVFPDVQIKNPLVFTEWPVEIQTIIQSGKNASKGVAKAITWCVTKIRDLTATKFDIAFASACLKCPATSMTTLLANYSAGSEGALPSAVKLAVIWCSKQSRPEEEFANLVDGKINLDQFKKASEELVKKNAPKEKEHTLESLIGGKKDKKKAEKKTTLQGRFTSAMTEAWVRIHTSLSQPAWLAKAAAINEPFVLFLIENDLVGSGTANISQNKDFSTYAPTTLADFARKFYAWRLAGDFFSNEENTKYSAQIIREGRALSLWNSIKNEREKVKTADGTESQEPKMVWDMTDLKNQVSRLPAERRSSENGPPKGKKNTTDANPTGQASKKSPRAAKRAEKRKQKKSPKPADDGNRRGRSRSRSSGPADASGGKKRNASKSRSQSRKGNTDRKEDGSWSQVVSRRSPKKAAATRGRSKTPQRERSRTPGSADVKSRAIKCGGKSYDSAALFKALPKDRKNTVTLGDNQFTAAFLERLLRNEKVDSIESALDAQGKVKAGYSWDPKNKRFVKERKPRDEKSSPKGEKPKSLALNVQPISGGSRSSSRTGTQARTK